MPFSRIVTTLLGTSVNCRPHCTLLLCALGCRGIVSKEIIEQPQRVDRRVHVALPIRVTYWDKDQKPCLELACTYDISSRGARVTGLRCVKETGEIIGVERGRNKAFCRVVWIGEPGSELHGQVGLQCVELDRSMWDAELRDMQEVYDPISREAAVYRTSGNTNLNGNRRRYRRFTAEGLAEVSKNISQSNQMEAALKDLSEVGCLVKTTSVVLPGTELKLVLNVANYDLTVKGQVKHAALDVGVGIEFREIRKGDRPILQYLLRKMAEKQPEQSEKTKAQAAIISL